MPSAAAWLDTIDAKVWADRRVIMLSYFTTTLGGLGLASNTDDGHPEMPLLQ